MVDHDLALDRRQRITLLAERGENHLLGGQDGGGIGRITRSKAELAHVDGGERSGLRPADGDAADLEARAGVDGQDEADLVRLGMGLDGIERGGLVDGMVVDRGGAPRVIEAARAQGRIGPRQHRLRTLQQGQAVARQGLGLFEIFDELLEVIAHGLVPRDDKDDLARPRLRAGAKDNHRRQSQACKPAQPGTPSHGELSGADHDSTSD